MNKYLLDIIKDENLQGYNLYGDHILRPEEVVLQRVNDKWEVFTTDERNVHISCFTYETEEDAVKDFLQRLRADKSLRELKENK